MKTENLKEQTIKDYDKIVRFVLKDMKLAYRYDELYDIGIIGFVNGINNYDESKGYKYITFLYDCIKNEIVHYLQYEKRKRRRAVVISLNSLINNNELGDFIPSYQDYDRDLYLEEITRIIDRRLADLDERDEMIFKHLYGLDGYKEMSALQLEKKFNMSRQNINRIKNRILKMLRYEIKDYYTTFLDILAFKSK